MLGAVLFAAAPARAEEPGFWRVSLSLGAGTGVRVRQHDFLAQERRTPAFAEVRFEGISAATGRFRHGPTVALATTLENDGPITGTTRALTQWVIEPGWRLRWHVGAAVDIPSAVFGLAIGIPVVVSPDVTAGVAGSLRGTWMIASGIGVGIDLGYSVFVGAEDRIGRTTLSSLVSLALVVVFERELLP